MGSFYFYFIKVIEGLQSGCVRRVRRELSKEKSFRRFLKVERDSPAISNR